VVLARVDLISCVLLHRSVYICQLHLSRTQFSSRQLWQRQKEGSCPEGMRSLRGHVNIFTMEIDAHMC
jgi:hypothetical protein